MADLFEAALVVGCSEELLQLAFDAEQDVGVLSAASSARLTTGFYACRML
jgi:hypothetical protein